MNNYYSIAYKINVQSQVCCPREDKKKLVDYKDCWELALVRKLESRSRSRYGVIL